MEYKYNGNLLEEDRINLVAKEVTSKYPKININNAKEIAMLEGRISEEKNLEIQFNRMYNIILIEKDNNDIIKDVYCDLVTLLKNNIKDDNFDYYYTITVEIANYIMGSRDFPYINEI
jgi:hypothetical protein